MTAVSAPPAEGRGMLWVVATPIGNLDDLSDRARQVLSVADAIAAEDTRTTRKLLPSRDRSPKWIALHEHNEAAATRRVIELVERGQRVALVSDAGTPLVSDPGFRLVRAAHEHGLTVSPVPGPCAVVAALSAAGLATDRFCFEGFPPARRSARRRRFDALRRATSTLVFFVPARDLPAVVADAAGAFGGERLGAVARELTKRFETLRRDRLAALAEWVGSDPDQRRGEAVLVIEGTVTGAAPQDDADTMADTLARELAAELPPARAARILARVTGLERKAAFERIESLR